MSVRRETIDQVRADAAYMRAEWLAEGGEMLAPTPEDLFDEWGQATKHASGGWARIEFEWLGQVGVPEAPQRRLFA